MPSIIHMPCAEPVAEQISLHTSCWSGWNNPNVAIKNPIHHQHNECKRNKSYLNLTVLRTAVLQSTYKPKPIRYVLTNRRRLQYSDFKLMIFNRNYSIYARNSSNWKENSNQFKANYRCTKSYSAIFLNWCWLPSPCRVDFGIERGWCKVVEIVGTVDWWARLVPGCYMFLCCSAVLDIGII